VNGVLFGGWRIVSRAAANYSLFTLHFSLYFANLQPFKERFTSYDELGEIRRDKKR